MYISRLATLFILYALGSGPAFADIGIQISEGLSEQLNISLPSHGNWSQCAEENPLFDKLSEVQAVSKSLFQQPLNSEIGEDQEYLKAARVGRGIYIYLPAFRPREGCNGYFYEIEAKHVFWNGLWHVGRIHISARDAQNSAVYLLNDALENPNSSIYLDQSLDSTLRAKLTENFTQIFSFYRMAFDTNPLEGIGIIAAIVRNSANYKGFGGDSLNIIRMSFDNPTKEDVATLDTVFSSVLTHELFHKLQSDSLFKHVLGRYITEGSADFVKTISLENLGIISRPDAKSRIMKAAANCEKNATSESVVERFKARRVTFREPYDCGMIYYFVSYYSSGSGDGFVPALLSALKNNETYSPDKSRLCLLYESNCENLQLRNVLGTKEDLRAAVAWLIEKLEDQPFPDFLRTR